MTRPELARHIGMESEVLVSELPVQASIVRRFCQAVMDENPMYWVPNEDNREYGGPVAPPLFPAFMFGRFFGSPDPIQINADNPDYDGLNFGGVLPEIEALRGYAMLNGGSELQFHGYARHGEHVSRQSRYADIVERDTRRGAMVFVTTENDYRNPQQELLLRVRTTLLWRAP